MNRPRIRRGEGRVLTLRVELQHAASPVWRRLEVSGRASLQELHDVIEAAFVPGLPGYEFVADGVHYPDSGNDPPPGRDAAHVALDDLHLHAGARITLSNEGVHAAWNYVVTLEHAAPRLVGQRLPVCTGGAGTPAEETDDHGDSLDAGTDRQHAPAAPYLDLTSINAALARVQKHRPTP